MKGKSKSSPRSGKTYVSSKGYRKFKDSGTYVHRWVEENKLGRKLKPGEVVHHRNGDTLDNSPGNLKVFSSQKVHMATAHNSRDKK
jgi:hypothetical protein